MTIKPGQAWGEPATLPDDAFVVRSDREISRALDEARLRNEPFPSFGVLAGDLGRTLAATGQPRTGFPIDVGEVLIDGRHHYFAAHVVARRNGWRDFAVAMNAQWIGEWNFGPKVAPQRRHRRRLRGPPRPVRMAQGPRPSAHRHALAAPAHRGDAIEGRHLRVHPRLRRLHRRRSDRERAPPRHPRPPRRPPSVRVDHFAPLLATGPA